MGKVSDCLMRLYCLKNRFKVSGGLQLAQKTQEIGHILSFDIGILNFLNIYGNFFEIIWIFLGLFICALKFVLIKTQLPGSLKYLRSKISHISEKCVRKLVPWIQEVKGCK